MNVNNTNDKYIILLKSMKGTKFDIYKKVIIPANLKNIMGTLKINSGRMSRRAAHPTSSQAFFSSVVTS